MTQLLRDMEARLAACVEAPVALARRQGVTVEVVTSFPAATQPGLPAPIPPALPVPEAASGPSANPDDLLPLLKVATAVVGEALGNTARHAGPTRAVVRAAVEDGWLRVSVVDSGPVAGWIPRDGTGTGLRGLRERVEACGGTLLVGPRLDAEGFAVEARLPLEERYA
ncbi:hypothetical protein [Actinomyces sp. MRS3W]|uniref:sensor histidine kinase n=1 Tax=Actinomyces sp. MRS3W TaxID=2800796 RepID=UPI0028FDAC81|nr:hypothetical protein [Actinomyces sp. MRS3W]MDU0349563.1 hypothetical protein [Actinomyces sp. MRS3W]